jgi:hypothetical protein
LRKRHLLLPLLLIASALLLVACGGGSDSNPEAEIEDAIETSATSEDPANCAELETQNFLEQTTSESGKTALKSCEEEAEDSDSGADSVEVTEVEVEGDQATAQATISGGNFDSQSLVIALVEEDDQWKLDEITEFAEFDQAAFVGQFQKELEAGEEVEPAVVSCIVEGLEEAPQEEIEELVLSGNSTPIEELAESCV